MFGAGIRNDLKNPLQALSRRDSFGTSEVQTCPQRCLSKGSARRPTGMDPTQVPRFNAREILPSQNYVTFFPRKKVTKEIFPKSPPAP